MNKHLWNALAALAFAALTLPGAVGAQTACVDGRAAGYPCSHVDLIQRLSVTQLGSTLSDQLNDVWGWTDADGVEYALVGLTNSTAFVRLPVPGSGAAAELLGQMPASDGASPETRGKSCRHDEACGNSLWRDIKTYGNYAYVVSEAPGHGMQIFDLRRLVGRVADNAVLPHDAVYTGFGHAHNLFINEASGRAYAVGNGDLGSRNDGGLFTLDLAADPLAPVKLAEINIDGYTHDVQCVNYAGPDSRYSGREICFASNEDTLTIIDVSNPQQPALLARSGYPGVQYTHQGWLSEDQRWFFLNDELDEAETGERTHLRVFDLASLTAPVLAADYYAPTLSIDHNNYTHGRWLYQTNYTAGFRMLDIDTPAQPVEAAYFDTQPNVDNPSFAGTWSNYRFPGSGRTVLSDIDAGLFIVQPQVQAGNGADLRVSLIPAQTLAAVSDSLPVALQIANAGTADASDVLLTLHLPRAAQWRFDTLPDGGSCDSTGRVVQCRFASLAAGASLAGELTVTASAAVDDEAVAMIYGAQTDADSRDNRDVKRLRFTGPATSGGGGGAFGLGLLILALAAALRRRMPRPSHSLSS